MSGNDELQWLWPLLLVLLTFHVQILNSLVAVIHCFSFGQWQAVLSRVAEALWGVVLHCALQLPPLSTASYLQLELEVSVLGKCLAAFDSEFTCAAFTAHFFLEPWFTHHPPSLLCRLGIKTQVLEAMRALCFAPASKEQVRAIASCFAGTSVAKAARCVCLP